MSMTLVAAYERLISGRGQEIKPDSKPGVREDVPTASIPAEPRLPSDAQPPAESAPVTEAPATVAAKPTEAGMESRSPDNSASGMPRDERVDAPSPVTASVPADAGSGHGGTDAVEPEGAGAGQQIGVRAVGRGFSRPGPRAWHIRHHLHAGDEHDQARHDGL